jgi:serine/threonine-protein kinase
MLAQLEHPAIVTVFDCGTLADGSAYLVMELVRGEDLRRELRREGRLDADRARRILSAVCSAIEAAHRQNVLHCDLKPENIMLPDEGVEAKVVDFGVARALMQDGGTLHMPPGAFVGTPAYTAPEQLRGHAPEPRTDVFSLGVIAYEMLTGSLPFGSGSVAEVMLAHARGIPAGALDAVPAPLARAVRAALSEDADRRPPSAQAFAHLVTAAGAM